MFLNYSEDYDLHGTYEVVYAVWYEEYQTGGDYYKIVSEPFVLTVIDECRNPYGLTFTGSLSDQEYTLTDNAKYYQID